MSPTPPKAIPLAWPATNHSPVDGRNTAIALRRGTQTRRRRPRPGERLFRRALSTKRRRGSGWIGGEELPNEHLDVSLGAGEGLEERATCQRRGARGGQCRSEIPHALRDRRVDRRTFSEEEKVPLEGIDRRCRDRRGAAYDALALLDREQTIARDCRVVPRRGIHERRQAQRFAVARGHGFGFTKRAHRTKRAPPPTLAPDVRRGDWDVAAIHRREEQLEAAADGVEPDLGLLAAPGKSVERQPPGETRCQTFRANQPSRRPHNESLRASRRRDRRWRPADRDRR